MKVLTLPIIILLFSCNSLSSHIEQKVDNEVNSSKREMNVEVQKSRQKFLTMYRIAVKANPDNVILKNVQDFHNAIVNIDSYLDSLKLDMDNLDAKDVNNVQLVRTTFIFNGSGDTIFNRLKASILVGQNLAKTEERKLKINAVSDNIFGNASASEWTAQTFGMTNPLGASMIIYGLQTELYNIGMTALEE